MAVPPDDCIVDLFVSDIDTPSYLTKYPMKVFEKSTIWKILEVEEHIEVIGVEDNLSKGFKL